jgi:hypothetical protein
LIGKVVVFLTGSEKLIGKFENSARLQPKQDFFAGVQKKEYES